MNLALAGDKLYMLNDPQEMQAISVIDIGLTKFSIILPGASPPAAEPEGAFGVAAQSAQGIVPGITTPENKR